MVLVPKQLLLTALIAVAPVSLAAPWGRRTSGDVEARNLVAAPESQPPARRFSVFPGSDTPPSAPTTPSDSTPSIQTTVKTSQASEPLPDNTTRQRRRTTHVRTSSCTEQDLAKLISEAENLKISIENAGGPAVQSAPPASQPRRSVSTNKRFSTFAKEPTPPKDKDTGLPPPHHRENGILDVKGRNKVINSIGEAFEMNGRTGTYRLRTRSLDDVMDARSTRSPLGSRKMLRERSLVQNNGAKPVE